MKAKDDLIAAAELLRQAVADLTAGNDVAPAKLFAIEALLTQALASGIEQVEIREVVEKLLPKGHALNIVDRDQRLAVTLLLCQHRAPVVPST